VDDSTPKSRTARTLGLLRDAIVHAHYAPGQKLRIDMLGREFDASAGAVREALSRLTAEGLVVSEPQKGFVVAPVSKRDLEDLTEVRIAVENRCLTDSIAHGDLAWEGRILSLQHQLHALEGAVHAYASPEADCWHALHDRFHDELAAACPNTWWLRLRRQLFTQSERYRRLSGPIESGDRDIAGEHEAIARAAIARDVAAATEAMKLHLQRTTDIILSSSLPFFDTDEGAAPEPLVARG